MKAHVLAVGIWADADRLDAHGAGVCVDVQ